MNFYKRTPRKTEFLYGFHSVFEALVAKRRSIYEVMITVNVENSDRSFKILRLAKQLCVKCSITKVSKIKLLTKSNIRSNFLAIVSPITILNFKNFFEKYIFQSKLSFLIISDGILDPYNLGAIVRTAYCVGALGIIITKDRSCSPSPIVSRISAGAMEHLPICCVTNLSRAIKELKKIGFWIMGVDLVDESFSLFDTKTIYPLAIVFGSEGIGLRRLVRNECDLLVSIPMRGKLNSLNVSVSAGVVLYEIFRRKLQK